LFLLAVRFVIENFILRGIRIFLSFFMIRWIPYAFLRIVLFFIAGITLGIYFPDILDPQAGSLLFLAMVLSYAVIVLLYWKKRFLSTNLKLLGGIVGLAAVFVSGFLQVLHKTGIRRNDHISHIESPIEFYKTIIAGNPVEKANSWKVQAIVSSVRTQGKWIDCKANILLYFSKDHFPSFNYGDVLLVKGAPRRVPGPANPEEFDYRRFLSFKNIYHQQFVKTGDAVRIGYNPPSWLEHFALLSRTWADEALKKKISGQREKGLASALVLGVTDGLDDELLTAYKATGTMHVLSVSGLHVGIVYGLVLFLLRPLNKKKFGRWIVAALSIIILWAYAFVTGLSPSVLRAVTMFSFVALAIPAGRRTNIYNTLAASAFFILWYDPFLIMSVGFQLSYIAVLGIVYMQPALYNLWDPTNRLWDEVWKITCVSIAAQLATLPLGLLYFHQFPNYFLLSNLFVIPGSFVVLILGILILVMNVISPIASFLGMLLEWTIKALNVIVFAIEDFPFSLIENVYITPLQCWLLFSVLVGILTLLHIREFRTVILISCLGVAFSLTQWYHFQQNVNVQKFMVYNVAGHSAIDLIDRGNAYFIADTSLQKNVDRISFHITPHRIKAGVRRTLPPAGFQQQLPGCALMVWKGKSFLQIYDQKFAVPEGLSVDFLIVSNNAVNNFRELESRIHIGFLILDSSNSSYFATHFLDETKTLMTNIYSVLHKGAFELHI
jgi:competence protein ComEC